jgi:hypothetical protein
MWYETWARYSNIGILVVLAFVLPLPPQVGGVLVALSFGIALFPMSISLARSGTSVQFFRATLFGVPFFLAACISMFFAGVSLGALFGIGFQWGTIGSAALFALAIGSGAFADSAGKMLFLYGIEAVGIVCVLAGVLLFAGILDPALLSTYWHGITLALGASIIVGAVLCDIETKLPRRILHAIVAACSVVAMQLFFDSAIAVVVLAVTAVYAGQRLIRTRLQVSFLPIAAGAVVAVIGLAILLGIRAPLLPLEGNVRPSLSASEHVIGSAFRDSLSNTLIGLGPMSFAQGWNLYRSASVNTSSRWDYTPATSYSTFAALPVEFGLVGLLLFFMFPAVLVWRNMRRIEMPDTEDVQKWDEPLAMLSIYCFAVAFVYPVGPQVLLAGMVSLVASSRFFPPPGNAKSYTNSCKATFCVAAAVCACIVGLTLIRVSGHQILAEWNHLRGTVLIAGSSGQGLIALDRAARLWGAPPYLHDASEAYATEAVTLRQNGGAIAAENVQRYAARAQELAVAADIGSKDFDSTLYNAALHIQFAEKGIVGLEDAAENSVLGSLDKAGTLAPTRPDAQYWRARLALVQGDTTAAKEALDKALELKADYKDAVELLNSLAAEQ